ncbi:YcxB family protein [Pseudoalteromonas tunicata]|jgi:uncharacterized membrane protein YobD (UPF0266 family)|uniref:YcxB-like protein domain-containing protein n=1 Tax=Pseudoalteromonas tunicata D2 TaxID=87626 RepID=A4CCI9_9GAMM|nr:YcxB family protein [Pseudoalteromonas tunicata]ATC93783.1 hypothetical protein PTUN_a1096 [Pseudoalteromonas tunicata]AXT29603.1 YcxB family protein [Pseudoalteromonas tunicata]EAR27282.1 hypothetical protein PTD2_14622 [Pseudoalteromonas tunicata D2]
MSFNFSFVLNKAYFTECFEQSELINLAPKRKLIFASGLIIFGLLLNRFTDTGQFAAYLLMGIGVLEFIAYYYRKPWWVTRQMWSRSANVTVTLIIDEEKIATQSIYHQLVIYWSDLAEVIDTPKGIIVVTSKNTRHYLSKAYVDEQAIAYITQQLAS